MKYNTIIIIINILLLLIPITIYIKLLLDNYKNKILQILAYTTMILYILVLYFIIPWGFFSIYVKYFVISLNGIIIVFIIYRSSQSFMKLQINPKTFSNIVLIVIYSVSIITLSIVLFKVSSKSYKDAIKLSFPLRGKNYYILDGGNNVIINQHYSDNFQKYAIDIIKLNKFKTHASGLFPSDNKCYEIFGEVIYSPCNGIVYDYENSIKDHNGPLYPVENKAGNYILIKGDDGSYILMAHLKYKSINIKKGQRVNIGDRIAKVGNTGNSSEPHLHIHAVRNIQNNVLLSGNSIPILFDDQFLIRNDIVNKK